MKKFRVNDEVYCDTFGDGVVQDLLVCGGVRIMFGGNMVNFFSSGRVNRGFAGQELLNNAPIPIFFRHGGRKDNLEREVELVVGETYLVRDNESQRGRYRFYVGELGGRHWFISGVHSNTLYTYKLIQEVPRG